jgi:hypothetical protein
MRRIMMRGRVHYNGGELIIEKEESDLYRE